MKQSGFERCVLWKVSPIGCSSCWGSAALSGMTEPDYLASIKCSQIMRLFTSSAATDNIILSLLSQQTSLKRPTLTLTMWCSQVAIFCFYNLDFYVAGQLRSTSIVFWRDFCSRPHFIYFYLSLCPWICINTHYKSFLRVIRCFRTLKWPCLAFCYCNPIMDKWKIMG